MMSLSPTLESTATLRDNSSVNVRSTQTVA
jgi:hypothetical protein